MKYKETNDMNSGRDVSIRRRLIYNSRNNHYGEHSINDQATNIFVIV